MSTNGQFLPITGLGKLYMGDELTKRFREAFGRDPTEKEFWMDWYESDFVNLKAEGWFK